jgi:MFS family permease
VPYAGPYAALLRLPGLASQAVLGLLAQLTQAAAPVGMVLVVDQATGSLAVAGLAVAGFSAAVAVARPLQGRAIDRRGSVPVLAATGVLHAGALAGLVLAAWAGAAGWALTGLACVAGLGLPPVSTSMRVVWGRRVPANGRTAAYSLVYLTQELAILTGPLLLAVLVALSSASLALVVTGATAAAGTLALAWPLRAAAPGQQAGGRGAVLRSPGMRAVLAVVFFVGLAFGALEVGLPALASARGVPAASGVLVAALSLGGICGALLYGGRSWTAHPTDRLLVLLVLLCAALAPLPALHGLVLTGAALVATGLALNPAITTASLVVDLLVPVSAAEAFGWLSTAISTGGAAGNAVAGVAAQHLGASASFLVPLCGAAAAAAVALLARARLPRSVRSRP